MGVNVVSEGETWPERELLPRKADLGILRGAEDVVQALRH